MMRSRTVAIKWTDTDGATSYDITRGSRNGLAIPAEQAVRASVQVVCAGGASPSGTITLQGSNDIPPAGAPTTWEPTNWTNIASASATVNANSTFLVPVTEVCHRFLRVAYAYTSGTGVITANLQASGWGS